jgi:hypothetical protein
MPDKKNNMIKYLKSLIQLILRPKNLSSLKTTVSVEAEKAINHLNKRGLPNEKKKKLSNYLTSEKAPNMEAIMTWMSEFFDEIVEGSFKQRKSFLYKHRWDIACLTKEEYSEFYDHLQNIEFLFIENINNTIKKQFLEIQNAFIEEGPPDPRGIVWIMPPKDSLPN